MDNVLTVPAQAVPSVKDLHALCADMETPEQVAAIYCTIKFYKDKLKEAEGEWKKRGTEVFRQTGTRSLDVSDCVKIILTEKKKDCFESGAILDALEFTTEQRAVLSGTPFRKGDKTKPENGGVVNNPKVAGLYSQDVGTEEIEVLNPKFVFNRKGGK